MKRAALLLLAAGLALVLGWPRDGGGTREGIWEGETTQGRWVRLVVEDEHIVKWGVALELGCARTGRRFTLAVVSDARIPVCDRRFAETSDDPTLWRQWAGAFGDDAAAGTLSMVWPVIVGDVLDEIEAETCVAARLGFTVRPRDEDTAAAPPPADVEIHIDAAGRQTITRPTPAPAPASARSR